MPVVLAVLAALLLAPAAEGATWQRAPLPELRSVVDGVAHTVDRAALRRQAARGGAALPAPDGRLVRFDLREAPVMEPGLQRRFPAIRTYAGRAVGDRATTVRLAVTPLGVHASVRGSDGTAWYVEPAVPGAQRHLSFLRTALREGEHPRLLPPVGEAPEGGAAATAEPGTPVALRTYRLALVSDAPYAQSSGAAAGLDPSAPDYEAQLAERVVAAKAVLMARVNQVYEADMAIRLLLIDGTERLGLNTPEAATGANGPCGVDPCFTAAQLSSCSSGLLTRNQTVAGLLVGARNFDVGHIALGAGGGGIAGLGVVGQTRKAAGCTGLPRPVGDVFAIDYVAHEIGHQFGANHTFDGVNGSCAATNRNLTGARAMEPGSGSTVMAYAGICLTDDLQAHTDPTFHQTSIEEIEAYVGGEEGTLSSVQEIGFRRAEGPVVVGYEGRTATAPDASAAALDAAIESVLPQGGTVTVAARAGGFTATFGGTLAGAPVALLQVERGGVPAVVGDTVTGGPTTRRGTTQATENRHPSVTAPAALTIPLQTPFVLTAAGEDPDGDALTYVWEQDDPALPAVGSPLQAPRVVGGLFRTFGKAARYPEELAYESPSPGQNVPAADPSRSFPDLEQVLADNTNALTGTCRDTATEALTDCSSEQLPTAKWAGTGGTGVLHFRVTARDNHPGAGGTAVADTAVTVAKGAGPFRVLDLPAAPVGGALPVAWSVARTDVLTGTTQVKVSLSTDGGATFPVVLAATTANDGFELLPLPAGVKTERGRIKVEAVGNVFYDVSHRDLAIG